MGERTGQSATLASAVAAFLALPALVAFAVPIGIALSGSGTGDFTPWGLAATVPGVLILASTVREFFTQGRGTLAPWNPPRALVVTGLFARCRNPMYVGVLLTIAGHAWCFGSSGVALYGVVAAVAFHVRVLVHEEPWARRTFPDAWPRYAENVPRWVPRLHAWRG